MLVIVVAAIVVVVVVAAVFRFSLVLVDSISAATTVSSHKISWPISYSDSWLVTVDHCC